MAQTLGTLLVDIKGDTTQLIQGFNRAEKAVTKTTQTMGSAVKVLTGVFASLQAIDLAKGYAKQVDELQNVNNRLKLATKTAQEFNTAQKELFTQAQNTRTMYVGTIDLYGRIAKSTQNLNMSQKELLSLTNSINKAMIIGGGSTESQQAALIQFGQAFSSNFKAVGQELGSIREQAPRLYEALIKGVTETNTQFKKLVDNGAEASGVFKKWAEDGLLSSEIIVKALKNQGIVLDSEFGKMVMTIEQSMVTARNSIQKLIYDFDQTSGVSKTVSENIKSLSSSIDSLSPEKVEKLAENFKEGAIAVATMYASVKATSLGFSAYGSIMEKINTYNKANIEIENARTKAINLGEQAVKARRLADEAFNVSKQSGLAMAEKHYQLLSKEAIQLENAAKKQQALSYSLEGTAKGFNIATIASNAFKGALASIPFIAISVAIGAVATALLSASRASQTLEGTLKSTGEELKKLTNNQLQYRKELLEQELIQTRLDMANAKARAAKSSATAEDKAERDEAVKNFEEQTQKLREIKQIQDELAKPTKGTNSTSGTTSGDGKNKKTPLNDELQGIIDKSVLIKRKYDELMEQLKSSGNATAENIKKLNDAQAEEIKSLSKDEIKEAKKSADEQKKILEDKQSQYYNYYEKIKDYDKLWILEEQKLREENKYLKQDEMNKLLEVEKQSFQKRYETEKEYLSADEWRDYYLKIKDYDTAWLIEQSELYVKFGDSLGENFARFAEIAKTEFYDKIDEENSKLSDEFFKFKLEFDTNGLNDLGKSLYTIRDATEELGKEQKLYNDAIWEARQHGKDTAKIEEQHTQNQLIGYSNIAGAMSTMYEEGSRQAAAFQAIQTTLALIEATRAIVSQGTGDPYTAIPRMIAMAAMVTSLLSNVGIAFGANKMTSSSDAFSSMVINEGKGTVIGDSDKVSQSITKSLDILENFAEPQFQTLVSMNKYLANISNAMGGVTTLLVRNAGFGLGQGFTPTETPWKNKIGGSTQTFGGIAMNAGLGALFPALTVSSTLAGVSGLFGTAAGGAFTSGVSGLLGAGASQALTGALVGTGVGLVTMLVDKFILGGVINKAIGSVLGGLFGKTKVSQSLEDSGIYFADTLLGNAIESIDGALYQTIKTVTTKKSWFSSSSSTRLDTYFEGMDNELERQFSLVLRNLYMVSVKAGAGLDVASNELTNKLNSFVVKFGKISLKGKNADEIQETLEGVFSQISDNIAEYLFPALIDFQKVGEGLFQTMTRVSTGMEEAEFYISRLGSAFSDLNYLLINNKQGDVGFEALLQSITKVEEKLYPTNNNLLKMIENLDLTAEELYQVYVTLEELRDRLIFLKQEAQGLSSAMVYGAGSVSDLQKGFDSFFENFLSDSEKLVYETEQLIEEFNKLNIALPVSKEAFKDLLSSLDLTTESGQELYGRLIILSETFASVADKTAESIAKLESELLELTDNGINDLSTSFEGLFTAIKGLKEIAISFIDSFSSSSLGNTRDQIKEYNKLRKQFNSFFDASGNLNANVTEKEAKEVYSKLAGLGSAIGKSNEDLQKDLVSQFENDLLKLDLSDQILKVDVVSGLADLLGLNESQARDLAEALKDNKITNSELENIGRLSSSQVIEIINLATKLNGGIKVTDSQIVGLTTLSQEQKAQLIKANADGVITTAELNNIKGLTTSSLAELVSMDNILANGIKVTDAQIMSLNTLSQEQKAQLIKANADGVITNTELKSINTLSQAQKDGITSFVNNSSYFSTEDTLQNLAQYSKLQLDAALKAQAEETEGLSKKTLTFGDYIGKKEQIDISKKLGVAYEKAKPLIAQLQSASTLSGASATKAVGDILGFKSGGYTYDKTIASQIEALKPYLETNVATAFDSIKNQASTNLSNAKITQSNSIANYEAQLKEIIRQINQQNLSETLWADYSTVLAMAKDFSRGAFDYGSGHGAEARAFSSMVMGNELPGSIRYGGGINYSQYEQQVIQAYYNKLGSIPISSDAIMNLSGYDISYPFRHWGGNINQNLSGLEGQSGLVSQLNSIQGQLTSSKDELNRLNSYAVGATNIPYDQIAQIHQGEMIIPKTFSEGLRTGELSLSATSPNVNFSNFNLMEGIKETMQDMFKSISEYPKKTHDLLDDVINGRAEMRVKTI